MEDTNEPMPSGYNRTGTHRNSQTAAACIQPAQV